LPGITPIIYKNEIYILTGLFPHGVCTIIIKRMKDFSRRIKAGLNFMPEFFFHRVFTVSGNQRYHVSVKDEVGYPVFFTMEQKHNEDWKIVDAPKVPDWIMKMETVLSEVVLNAIEA
jgi:hypothetical protein